MTYVVKMTLPQYVDQFQRDHRGYLYCPMVGWLIDRGIEYEKRQINDDNVELVQADGSFKKLGSFPSHVEFIFKDRFHAIWFKLSWAC